MNICQRHLFAVVLFILFVLNPTIKASVISVGPSGTTSIPLNNYSSLSGMCNDMNGTAFDLGCVVSGGSAVYSANIQQAGMYALTANYASPIGNTAAQILINGTQLGSVSFSSTGNWSTYVNAAPITITLPAGMITLTVQAQNSGFNLGALTLTPVIPTIAAAGTTNIPLQGYSAITGMCADSNGAAFDLGCVQVNGSAVYPVNVAQAGSYAFTFTYASPTGNTAAQVLVNSTQLGSASFSSTGGWSIYVTASPIIITLPAGSTTLTLQAQNSGFNLGGLNVVPYTSGATSTSSTGSSSTLAAGAPVPIAWWKFDQSAGTTVTDSAGNYSGTLLNGASWTSGESGNAVAVGSSNLVNGGSVSLPVGLPSTFTLSFWAKTNGYGSASNIENNVVLGGGVYQTNGFRAGFSSAGVFTFWTTESGGTLTLTDTQGVAVGTWNQFVIAYQNSSAALYRNGELVATATGSYLPDAAPTGIDSALGGVNYFWGSIDDLRVYNQALPGSLTNQFGAFGSASNQVMATFVPSFGGTVPASYFGMTIFSLAQPNTAGATTTTPFPPFAVSTMRLWDVAPWQQIEPASGQYNWTNIDRTVLLGAQNGVTDYIFTMGHSPSWASSNPSDNSCSEGAGSCDYPNMTAFDSFLAQVVTRYCGVVKYYEPWNEPDNSTFWNGTNAQLLTIASHVYSIVKSPSNCSVGGANPNQVLLPPVSSLGTQSLAWLNTYLAAGGNNYPYADIAAFHGYGYDVPEGIVQGVTAFKQLTQHYGLGKLPIWNTEASWGTHTTLVPQQQDASWLMRYHLAQAGTGVTRFVWYGYDNCALGGLYGVACDTSNKPLDSWSGIRAAGQSFGVLQQWIVGKTLNHCDQYENGMWACQVQGTSGYNGWILWSTSGSFSMPVPSGQFTGYRDWENNTYSLPTTLTIGNMPLLLED